MKEYLRMIGVMTAFCLVAGLMLAATHRVTRAPIEVAQKQELNGALGRVLPPHDNDVVADARAVAEGGVTQLFYVARHAGQYAGVAFRASANGYGGPVDVLVGLTADGGVNALVILSAEKETPGLGSKIREPAFLAPFRARAAARSAEVAVTKDGGQIAAITGATISSRAVCRAVKAGLDLFAKHADQIKGAP
jgi:electron transport complex protein RnfG